MPQAKRPTEAAASELSKAANAIRQAAVKILQDLAGSGSPVEMMTPKYDWLQPIVKDVLIRQLFDKTYNGYQVKDGPLRREISDSAGRMANVIVQTHLTPDMEKRIIKQELSKKMTAAAVKRALSIAIEEAVEDRAREIMQEKIKEGVLDPAICAAINSVLRNGKVPPREKIIELILDTTGTEGENE